MKFLIATQLPGTLARWLRGRGCDAVHVLDLELGQACDRELWELALEEGRIVVSKDEDFFILATRPGDQGRLLWLRMGKCRTQPLLATLNRHWTEIENTFSSDQRILEMR